MATYSSIGKSVPRLDGTRLVSGAGQYTADHHPPGTLWARLLRSAEPHARLVRVDASRARALPGVHAGVTGADTGGGHLGSQRRDWPLLALDRVRFVGAPIAAAAAEDLDTGDEAIQLIDVEYEPLPGVFDARQALRADAPLLHPDIRSYHGTQPPSDVPNLQGGISVGHGDVEQGFAEADL